jgi:hypothetical protein
MAARFWALSFIDIEFFLTAILDIGSACSEMVHLARVQGGQWIQTGGILAISRI